MKRIVRISAAILAMVVICAALGVGVWWLFSALPTPATVPDAGVVGGMPAVSVVPRMVTIPWKRDPEVLPAGVFTGVQIPLPGGGRSRCGRWRAGGCRRRGWRVG